MGEEIELTIASRQASSLSTFHLIVRVGNPGGGGGVLPYMGYIGMCRCEGYGFQAVYSRIGYINESVWL